MTALTKDKRNTYEVGDTNEFPLASGAKVFLGSAVGMASGQSSVRALVATDKFLGFAIDSVDNTGGAAGALNVRVKTHGMIEATVAGLAATTAVGTSVYLSDDNTFTLTGTSNSLVGKVHRVLPGGTKAIVRFDADLV